MAVAVRAHVDGLQLADVLGAVVAAGRYGAVNGLIHDDFPPLSLSEQLLTSIVPGFQGIMLSAFLFAFHCKATGYRI